MSIYFSSQGVGHDVVLLHGWALHGGVWQRVAQALAEEYCVHLPDLPGHGRSAAVSTFMLDEIVESLHNCFPLPVQVVGWSLGGLIAAHWARRYPQHIKSLTLVASSPYFIRQPDWPHAQAAETVNQLAQQLDQQFDTTIQRFLALQTLGSDSAKTTLAALRELVFAHGRPSGLLAALQLLQNTDYRPHLADITVPTLVLAGARDALTPLAAAQTWANGVADGRLQVFPQASHAPFLSHETEFLQALRPFLAVHV